MQVTETLSDGLKRGYTVVVPAADIESKRATRLADLGKTLNLPGFRPGKVPLMVVRQRYGSAVTAEVLEESVSEATQQVLSERGLRPALQPKIDVVSLDAGAGAAKDLEFKVELELLPDITLPDFSDVEADPAEGGSRGRDSSTRRWPTSPQRNRELVEISRGGAWRPRRGEGRGADASISSGSIDGAEFPGGTGTDIDVEIGGTGFIPGFTEQLEGMKPGESRTIEVTFPEDYGAPNLAGKAGDLRDDGQEAEPRGGAGS